MGISYSKLPQPKQRLINRGEINLAKSIHQQLSSLVELNPAYKEVLNSFIEVRNSK